MLKKVILFAISIFISLFCMNLYAYNWAEWDISKTSFTIDVRSLTPGWDKILDVAWSWNSKSVMNNILAEIIYDLMAAIWVTWVLAMTIWWGYMIVNLWKDDLLSKWKSIFQGWLIALSIALMSWLIVKLVAFLLY